ncbi:ABC transporter substrate-binding protein [Microtetraspora fusca]|uniref:ABC transporter substrate-binding protein n=1 Tax=Microtetraspora fusca TaxID=1997 RepID=UPI00082E0137|nr:ABC transporter substrate-binding protein [Microtetraspora fusca]
MRLTAVCLSLLALGATVAGCGTSNDDATLTMGLSTAPTTLDPSLAQVGWLVNGPIQLAYEPLIRMGNDGTLQPAIAAGWKFVGSDNTKLSVSLRSGVKFADGSPVTADAVVDSINHIRKAGGPNASAASLISGAKKVDDSTVEVTATAPVPNLPALLTQSWLVGDVISPAGLAAGDKLATTTYGAGPYTLDSSATVVGDTYTFTANPHYWNKARQAFKRVVVKVITDGNALLNAMKSGQVDFAGGDWAAASSAGSAGLKVSGVGNYFAGFFIVDRSGATSKPLGDVRVRQAMNYAIDRASIAKAVYRGYGRPTSALTSPGADSYGKAVTEAYPYDPGKAKSLLAEAGYPTGVDVSLDGCKIQLRNCRLVQQAMIDQLAKVGVRVHPEFGADIATYTKMSLSKKYGLVYMSYGTSPFNLMHTSLASMLVTPYNPFGDSIPEVTALVRKADATADTAERNGMYNRALTTLTEQAWFLPAVNHDTIYFSRARVGNVPDRYGAYISAPDVTQFTAHAGSQ